MPLDPLRWQDIGCDRKTETQESVFSLTQASAARATADAAQAAQTGNIEGAALAVIEAVKAVQVSATGKSEVKVDASPMQSRLCVIL